MVLAVAQPAWSIGLDRGGLKPGPIKVTTLAQICPNFNVTKAWQGTGGDGAYEIVGACKLPDATLPQFSIKAQAQFKWLGQWGDASESIEVIGPAPVGGTILTSVKQCDKDPFVSPGVFNCTGQKGFNFSGMQFIFVWPQHPLLAGAVPANLVGTAGQALTASESLSDWNPYGVPGSAKRIEVIQPATDYAYIPVAEPPGFSYDLVLHPKTPGLPKVIHGEFQRATLEDVVGDIAMPGGTKYPTSWTTIPSPLSKWSVIEWASLPPTGVRDRKVRLYTGKNNALFTPGLYRMRVRAQYSDSGPWYDWEPWRYFWVGTQQFDIETVRRMLMRRPFAPVRRSP